MMSPGLTEHPEHNIVLEETNQRVEVFMNGSCVAETRDALKLVEEEKQSAFYIPWDDVRDIEFIKRADHHCPFRGQAEVYDVKHGSERFERAAWSYTRPYDDFRELKGRVAFYPERVQLIRVTG